MVECLIADYRARSASDFEAWDLAREDYRLISTSGGDAMLRDAEHYLFRYYLATQLDDVVWIPDGLPFNIPSEYNPPIPMNAFVMQYWHDPLYNELVRPVLEQFMDVAPTTESMTEWEERGWHDGFCAVGQCDFREAYEEHRDQRNEYYSDPAVISGIGGP